MTLTGSHFALASYLEDPHHFNFFSESVVPVVLVHKNQNIANQQVGFLSLIKDEMM